MASEFRIYQYGKPKPISPKWTIKNNMQNPPACIQSFHFYFNNGKTINLQGGGGICAPQLPPLYIQRQPHPRKLRHRPGGP